MMLLPGQRLGDRPVAVPGSDAVWATGEHQEAGKLTKNCWKMPILKWENHLNHIYIGNMWGIRQL